MQKLSELFSGGGDGNGTTDRGVEVRRRYDFSPLLKFLSKIGPVELVLANRNLILRNRLTRWSSSSRSHTKRFRHRTGTRYQNRYASLGLAYAVVSWLQKHNLCFSFELLYSILIHALGRSEKLYEVFLLSQKQSLIPLTYNALIGASARNNDIEKALNLISRMRQDGYQSDFVNYSLVIQALMRSNKIDSAFLQRLYREIERDKLELHVQLVHVCASMGSLFSIRRYYPRICIHRYGTILEKFHKQDSAQLMLVMQILRYGLRVSKPFLKKNSIATKGSASSSCESNMGALINGISFSEPKPAATKTALLLIHAFTSHHRIGQRANRLARIKGMKMFLLWNLKEF